MYTTELPPYHLLLSSDMRACSNPVQLWLYGPHLNGSMPTENAAYSGLLREKLNPLLSHDLPSCQHCDDSANLFPAQGFYAPPSLRLHGLDARQYEDVKIRSTTGQLFMRTNKFFLATHSSVLATTLQWAATSPLDGLLVCEIGPPIGCSMTQVRWQRSVGYILAWWHGAVDSRAPCLEVWPHPGITKAQFLLDIFTQVHFWSAVDLLRKLFTGELAHIYAPLSLSPVVTICGDFPDFVIFFESTNLHESSTGTALKQYVTMEQTFTTLLKCICLYTTDVKLCEGFSFNYFIPLVSCLVGRGYQRRSNWYVVDEYLEDTSVCPTPAALKLHDKCVDPFTVVKLDACPKAILLSADHHGIRSRYGYLELVNNDPDIFNSTYDYTSVRTMTRFIRRPLASVENCCYYRETPGYRFGNHADCIEDVVLRVGGESRRIFAQKKIWFRRVYENQAVQSHFAGFRWGCSATKVIVPTARGHDIRYLPISDRSDCNFLPTIMSAEYQPMKARR